MPPKRSAAGRNKKQDKKDEGAKSSKRKGVIPRKITTGPQVGVLDENKIKKRGSATASGSRNANDDKPSDGVRDKRALTKADERTGIAAEAVPSRLLSKRKRTASMKARAIQEDKESQEGSHVESDRGTRGDGSKTTRLPPGDSDDPDYEKAAKKSKKKSRVGVTTRRSSARGAAGALSPVKAVAAATADKASPAESHPPFSTAVADSTTRAQAEGASEAGVAALSPQDVVDSSLPILPIKCHQDACAETNGGEGALAAAGPLPCALCDAKVVQLVRHVRAHHGEHEEYEVKMREARMQEQLAQLLVSPASTALAAAMEDVETEDEEGVPSDTLTATPTGGRSKKDKVSREAGRQAERNNVRPKNTQCPICDKVVRRYDLNKHIKNVHSGEKPNKCPYCDYASPWKGNLNTHVAGVHTKARLHECVRCGLTFKTRGAMIGHMRKVHDKMYQPKERNFECEECHKKFFKKFHLQRHVRVHTGEKPYTCAFCEKRFTSKTNMDTHIQSVHLKIKPFKCGYCEKGFGRKKMMLLHIRKYHMNKGDGGDALAEGGCSEEDDEGDEQSDGGSDMDDVGDDPAQAMQTNLVLVKIPDDKDSNGQQSEMKQYVLIHQEHLRAAGDSSGVGSKMGGHSVSGVAMCAGGGNSSSSSIPTSDLEAIVWQQAPAGCGGDAGIVATTSSGGMVWHVDQSNSVLQAVQAGDGSVILLAAPAARSGLHSDLTGAAISPDHGLDMAHSAANGASSVDLPSGMLLPTISSVRGGIPLSQQLQLQQHQLQQHHRYYAAPMQAGSMVMGSERSSDAQEQSVHGHFDDAMDLLV